MCIRDRYAYWSTGGLPLILNRVKNRLELEKKQEEQKSWTQALKSIEEVIFDHEPTELNKKIDLENSWETILSDWQLQERNAAIIARHSFKNGIDIGQVNSDVVNSLITELHQRKLEGVQNENVH